MAGFGITSTTLFILNKYIVVVFVGCLFANYGVVPIKYDILVWANCTLHNFVRDNRLITTLSDDRDGDLGFEPVVRCVYVRRHRWSRRHCLECALADDVDRGSGVDQDAETVPHHRQVCARMSPRSRRLGVDEQGAGSSPPFDAWVLCFERCCDTFARSGAVVSTCDIVDLAPDCGCAPCAGRDRSLSIG